MAEDGYKVTLNVYDLSQGLARQLSTTFLGKAIEGIWHTGLVVYGNEYFFGGGIQCLQVGKTAYGKPVTVVELGVTHVPKELFDEYLNEISPRYTMETYDLFNHNCNNFSNEVAQFLLGATIPDYILQLPNEVLNSPFSSLILPMIRQLESTLKAGAVPQAPQFNPVPSSVQSSNAKPTLLTLDKAGVVKSSDQATGSGKVPEKSSQVNVAAAPVVEPGSSGDQKAPSGGLIDPLGEARNKVQDEIMKEFTILMASGTLGASEAATLAARRVMQQHGSINTARG